MIASLISNFALDVSHTIIDHDGVLLESHLLLLKLTGLLFEESDLIQIVLLQLTEIFLKIIDVLQDLFKDIIEALCTLVLQGSALRSQKLRVFFIVIQLPDPLFNVEL